MAVSRGARICFILNLLAIYALSGTFGAIINICEPLIGKIHQVRISDCFNQNDQICTVARNSAPNISIDFEYLPARPGKVANVVVNVVLPEGIVSPPVDIDGCARGIECPMQPGSNHTFMAPIPIHTQHIPPFEVAYMYQMKNDRGMNIVCFQTYITVGDKKGRQ